MSHTVSKTLCRINIFSSTSAISASLLQTLLLAAVTALIISAPSSVHSLSCSDIPTITNPSPTGLFSFCPIESTATATFDFFIASTVTSPQGMQSGYATRINAGETLKLTKNFWWSGTLGIFDKLHAYLPGANESFCTWNVIPMFRQTRYGIMKTSYYNPPNGVAMSPSYVATANSAFDFTLRGDDSQDYNTLFGASGFKMDIAFSEHRECDESTKPTYKWIGLGSNTAATIDNATAIRWSVPSSTAPQGIYSVCLRFNNSAGVTTGWFPLAAANGHYRHNLVVGSVNTGPIVDFRMNGDAARYGTAGILFIEKPLTTAPYTHYSVDSSLDVCSPTAIYTFLATMLANWNTSHSVATTTINAIPQQPGGGFGVICGATKQYGPWMLASKNAIFVDACDPGQGYNGTGCFTCDCNNVGICNTEKTIDYTSKSGSCTCFSGFYGTNCQFGDLPPPNSSLANDTVVRRTTVVTFMTQESDWFVHYNFTVNGTQGSCTGICTVTLPAIPRNTARVTYTIKLWSTHTNGSATLESRRPTYIFHVEPPTLSDSISESQTATHLDTESTSLTLSQSKTITPPPTASTSQSETATETVTVTPPPTRSATKSPTRTLIPTATKEHSDTRSRWTMNETICAAALNATPATFQSPTTSIRYALNESMRCGMCAGLRCSWGFAASCNGPDEFAIDLAYLSLFPTANCTVDFFDSVSNGNVSIPLPITVLPTEFFQTNLWVPQLGMVLASGSSSKLLRTSGSLSVALLNYSAAPPRIPYAIQNSSIQIRVCDNSSADSNESVWYDLTILENSSSGSSSTSAKSTADILTEIPLPAGTASSVCVEVRIRSPPMHTANYIITLFLSDSFGEGGNRSTGFVQGDAAQVLIQVGEGRYLPPTKPDPSATTASSSSASFEVVSAFEGSQGAKKASTSSSSSSSISTPSTSTVAADGLGDITDFTAGTWAVAVASLFAGGFVIWAVYQMFKPKPRDHVSKVVNAMVSPADFQSN